MPDAPPSVQALSAREAGLPVDDTLFDGAPDHLLRPLQRWIDNYLDAALLGRVALRLRVAPIDEAGGRTELRELLTRRDGRPLLEAVDMALQLDRRLHVELAMGGKEYNHGAAAIAEQYDNLPDWLCDFYEWGSHCTRGPEVERLDQMLLDAGSAYQVDWHLPPTLTRRVDPTVVVAFEHTLAAATPPAAELLRDAWRQVYGLHPDPTTGYGNAVRAVEEVLCPLVLPHDQLRTLGKTLGELRRTAERWSFVLVGKDGTGDIAPLLAIVGRLWEGQHARHGGTPDGYQPQTEAEAEAAVHLAATVVQWISSGALRRRNGS